MPFAARGRLRDYDHSLLLGRLLLHHYILDTFLLDVDDCQFARTTLGRLW